MRTPPDYHLDALFRAALTDEADVVTATAVDESEMAERVGRVLARRRKRRLTALLLAAALTTLAAGAIAFGSNRLPIPLTPERSPHASGTPEASLPALGLPGTSRAAGGYLAGEYGWTGTLGSITGMHSVTENPSSPGDFRQIQLIFAIEDDCFANGTDVEPVQATIAGHDSLYVEPYEDPGVLFAGPRGTATTGAYALTVGDRTLCVYLTWDAATTQVELQTARQVLESLRSQPFGVDGIRITFTLPAGWDTG